MCVHNRSLAYEQFIKREENKFYHFFLRFFALESTYEYWLVMEQWTIIRHRSHRPITLHTLSSPSAFVDIIFGLFLFYVFSSLWFPSWMLSKAFIVLHNKTKTKKWENKIYDFALFLSKWNKLTVQKKSFFLGKAWKIQYHQVFHSNLSITTFFYEELFTSWIKHKLKPVSA